MYDDLELRKRYASLDDDELIEFACYSARTFRPEARDLLKAEVRLRGLHLDIEKGMAAQLETFTVEMLADLVARCRRLPCPLCGDESYPLNAFPVVEVRSFLWSKKQEWLALGCPSCIEKQATRCRRVSMLRGWWGFLGWLFTLEALGTNRRAQRAGEHPGPTRQFIEYVEHSRGYFTALFEAPPAVMAPVSPDWSEFVN